MTDKERFNLEMMDTVSLSDYLRTMKRKIEAVKEQEKYNSDLRYQRLQAQRNYREGVKILKSRQMKMF